MITNRGDTLAPGRRHRIGGLLDGTRQMRCRPACPAGPAGDPYRPSRCPEGDRYPAAHTPARAGHQSDPRFHAITLQELACAAVRSRRRFGRVCRPSPSTNQKAPGTPGRHPVTRSCMASATLPTQEAAAPGVLQPDPSHTRSARVARAADPTSMLPSGGRPSRMRFSAAVIAAARPGRTARCSSRPGDTHPVKPATAWRVHASKTDSSASSPQASSPSSTTSRARTVSRAASLVQNPEPRYSVKLVPTPTLYDRSAPDPLRSARLRCREAGGAGPLIAADRRSRGTRLQVRSAAGKPAWQRCAALPSRARAVPVRWAPPQGQPPCSAGAPGWPASGWRGVPWWTR